MMQPYRFAIASTTSPTCHDPPLRPCAGAAPRRRLPTTALAAALAVVPVTGFCAARALGQGGHVEIDPHALALAHARHGRSHARSGAHTHGGAARTRLAPAARMEPVARKPLLSGLHDPQKLLARAKKLAAMGLDVSVSEVRLSHDFTAWTDFRNDFWPIGSRPIYDARHVLGAFELHGIPTDSPLHVAGFAEGDRLLGVDGFDFDDGSIRRLDVLRARTRGWLVAEVTRGEHHVVLSIRWTPPE